MSPFVKETRYTEEKAAKVRALVGFTDENETAIAGVRSQLLQYLPPVVDGFYSHLSDHDELHKIVSEFTTVDRLKKTFRVHLEQMINGPYGAEYCEQRIRVGITHYRVRLEPIWYLGMYTHLTAALHSMIANVFAGHAGKIAAVQRAFGRLMSMDQMLAMQAYTIAYSNALKERIAAAQVAREAKSMFLASMSHELRTPLHVMLGSAELLRKKPDRAQEFIYKRAEVIERNAKHLLQLIDDILDLAKTESGHMQVHERHFALGDFLDQICDHALELAKNKQVVIERNYEAVRSLKMRTDPGKVEQILVNLIGNAIKFTDTGTVALVANAVGQQIVIKVIDTGCGIPGDQLAAIFEEFKQVQGGANRKEGAGLGLALSRKLADLLHGRIEVQSKEGEGSTFYLYLPMT